MPLLIRKRTTWAAIAAAIAVTLLLAVGAAAISVLVGQSCSGGAGTGLRPCTSTCQYGLYGGGAGEFGYPQGVATDSSGDVYVGDGGNNRIDEFSAAELPPGTKITESTLNQKRHLATFSFKAIGTANGFQCALVKAPKTLPTFKSCTSPKTYKHLKPGTYTFEVRAFNAAGADPTPAKKSFTID